MNRRSSGLLVPDHVDTAVQPVRGHGRIELFDERTGRCQHREDFENFIAIPALDHNKWMVRKDYSEYFPTQLSGTSYYGNYDYNAAEAYGDPEPMFPLRHLVLTDSGATENPSTETYMPGNIIAWSNTALYTGADARRGTPNTVESTSTPTSTKWVFDWPTSAGNGTFQSVGWVALEETSIYQIMASALRGYLSRNVPQSRLPLIQGSASPVSPNYFAAYDPTGDKLYITGFEGSSNVWVVPWSTKAYPTSPQFRPTSMLIESSVVCAGLFYACSGSGSTPVTVHAYPLTSTGFPTAPTRNFAPACWNGVATSVYGQALITSDGSTLWGIDKRGTIFVIDPTTGATVSSAAISGWSGNTPSAFAYDANTGDLFIGCDNRSIFRVSPSGTIRFRAIDTGVFNYSQPSQPQSFFCKDSLLYVMSASWYIQVYDPAGSSLGTRKKLSAPVTKASTQTMKVTYEFDYS